MKLRLIIVGIIMATILMPFFTSNVKGETKSDIQEIGAGDSYTFQIQAGDGDLTISWQVTDWNDDNLYFGIQSASGGYVTQTNDVQSFSDTIYIEAGYYVVKWENNNWLEGITITFTLTYKSFSEEVDEACCSSFFIPLIVILSVAVFIGLIYKNK